MQKITATNIDNWELIQLQNFLNIKPEDFKLLLQAYRRKNTQSDGVKPYTNKQLGRGLHSEFKKCKFFKTDRPQEKIENWYGLTNSGIEVLKVIEEYLEIPKTTKDIAKYNLVLTKF